MSAPVLDDRDVRASLGHFASGVTVVRTVDGVVVHSRTWAVWVLGEVTAVHGPSGSDDGSGPELPLLYHRSHYGAQLRSVADKHSDVTLRAAIIDDGAGADIAAQATDRSGWQ